MENLARRKIFRDMWKNKARSILVILSIAVGVFAVGLVVSLRTTLVEGISNDYLSANPASAIIETVDSFDEGFVDSVRNMPEVGQVEGRSHINVRFFANGEWQSMRVFAVESYEAITVNEIWSEEGAYPPVDGEILIERSGFGNVSTEFGQALLLENTQGLQRELIVTGTTHEAVQAPTTFTGVVNAYVTFDTFEQLGGQPFMFNELHLIVAENDRDKPHIQSVINLVQDRLERNDYAIDRIRQPQTPGTHTSQTIAEGVAALLAILGVLTLILSGFLVVNTISATLTRQSREIGIMKTLGASQGQVVRMHLLIPLVFGLIAMIVAIPLSSVASRALSTLLLGLLNFNAVSLATPMLAIVLMVLVSIAVPIISGLFPIMRASRMTIRQAIDDQSGAEKPFGVNWFDKFLQRTLLSMNILSRPLRLSLRNTFRRKGRMILTLMTLILGSAIFMSVLSVRASAINTLDEAAAYRQYDIEVTTRRPYRTERIIDAALQVEGITNVEGWGLLNVRRVRSNATESVNITMMAPNAESFLMRPALLDGRWLEPGDTNQIVVDNEVIREEGDISVGDSLVLKANGEEVTWEVVGIATGQLRGPIVYVNYPHFSETIGQVDSGNRFIFVTNQHDAESRTAIAAALESNFKSNSIEVGAISTANQLRDQTAFQFNIIVILLVVMAILLSLVGGLGLMGTMGINVLERTREIGVMRSIGASNGMVMRVFIVEGIIIGVLSWLIGAIVSQPLSQFLSNAVGMALLQTPLNYTFSFPGVGLWLLIAIIIATLASYIPARNAARLSVRQVLAYE